MYDGKGGDEGQKLEVGGSEGRERKGEESQWSEVRVRKSEVRGQISINKAHRHIDE